MCEDCKPVEAGDGGGVEGNAKPADKVETPPVMGVNLDDNENPGG